MDILHEKQCRKPLVNFFTIAKVVVRFCVPNLKIVVSSVLMETILVRLYRSNGKNAHLKIKGLTSLKPLRQRLRLSSRPSYPKNPNSCHFEKIGGGASM